MVFSNYFSAISVFCYLESLQKGTIAPPPTINKRVPVFKKDALWARQLIFILHLNSFRAFIELSQERHAALNVWGISWLLLTNGTDKLIFYMWQICCHHVWKIHVADSMLKIWLLVSCLVKMWLLDLWLINEPLNCTPGSPLVLITREEEATTRGNALYYNEALVQTIKGEHGIITLCLRRKACCFQPEAAWSGLVYISSSTITLPNLNTFGIFKYNWMEMVLVSRTARGEPPEMNCAQSVVLAWLILEHVGVMKLMLSPLYLWFIEYKFKMRKGPIPGAASSPSKGGCSSITGHCKRPNSKLLIRGTNSLFVGIPNKCWISKSLFRLVDLSGPICSGSLIPLVYYLLYLLVPVGQAAEINGFSRWLFVAIYCSLEPEIKICVRVHVCVCACVPYHLCCWVNGNEAPVLLNQYAKLLLCAPKCTYNRGRMQENRLSFPNAVVLHQRAVNYITGTEQKYIFWDWAFSAEAHGLANIPSPF